MSQPDPDTIGNIRREALWYSSVTAQWKAEHRTGRNGVYE